MPVFLGLDCGGTSCRAMAIDESGQPVFLAQGGSANLATTPEATLDRSLRRALEGVPPIDVACACFAGLISDEKRVEAARVLTPLLPETRLRIEPDYAAALRSCPEGTTVCVVAGTGSIVCSRTADGLVKSGGGGYLLGDEGSGFRFGRAAMRRFIADPGSASEPLREAIGYAFGTLDPTEAMVTLYRSASPASILASLAIALHKDAQRQEPYALAALKTEFSDLAAIVADHLRRFHSGDSAPAIGLAGGLWKRASFREAFETVLTNTLPESTVHTAQMPPVRGAALLAMEMAA